MSSSSFSGLPSRTTLCIIFPTISPFGLDGNHDDVWLPQQISTLTPCHSPNSLTPLSAFKHHVTLPLWHQGQRVDQNQHTLPLFSSCGRSVLQIWYILKWPSSPWVHAESSNIFVNEVHDSMNFLSPKTHTYINYPTKWIYIWDSSTQPSGFTHLTSPYMTEYYNFTSWVSTWPFHQTTNITLRPTPESPQEREHISEPS